MVSNQFPHIDFFKCAQTLLLPQPYPKPKLMAYINFILKLTKTHTQFYNFCKKHSGCVFASGKNGNTYTGRATTKATATATTANKNVYHYYSIGIFLYIRKGYKNKNMRFLLMVIFRSCQRFSSFGDTFLEQRESNYIQLFFSLYICSFLRVMYSSLLN